MCGFLGEFCFDGVELTASQEFESLLSFSKHRGPDDTKIIRDKYLQLGFNRLSIIDLSEKGNQPMLSVSSRYQLVFNGEIYNFKELIEKYNISNLKSTSDTEVILHLLDCIGVEQTIRELDGMFALGIIDLYNSQLFLIRDFAGIKPLFYGVHKKGVVFASQFNQIFNHPFFKSSLKFQDSTVKEYFGFGYMQAPNTIYQDIYQVKPGEIICIDLKGEIKKKIFCSFPKQLKKTRNNLPDKYIDVLQDCVSSQLVSDVPLATFLSGGIDSPLITSLAFNKNKEIESYTLGIENSMYDESGKAISYAKELGVSQKINFLNEKHILSKVNEHFNFLGEPFGDCSSIPSYAIIESASKEYSVILSGDGGDELFFGYPRMQDILLKYHWFKIPFSFRKPLVRVFNKLGIINSWALYSNKKLKDLIQNKHLHVSKENLDKMIPKVLFSDELEDLYTPPKKLSGDHLLHWLRWNEFYAHMQRILIKVDRTSMAHSMEVRVPFLGKKSIRNAWEYIPKIVKGKFALKGMLKQCLSLYIPRDIIEENKKGFSVPIEYWLRNQLRNDLKKVIFEMQFYGGDCIEKKAVQEYVSDFLLNKHNESWGVWNIYAWQKWAISENLI